MNCQFFSVSRFTIHSQKLTIDIKKALLYPAMLLSLAKNPVGILYKLMCYGLISSAFPLMHLMPAGSFTIMQSEMMPYFWLNAFTFSV